ncbi:MAG TPA: HNH endonuclease signature motif containing protein [Candidatus Binataceae bacterium]|nr:HNH endonuclease signature motif containing protein [Candidatus Binataceae bacterium]
MQNERVKVPVPIRRRLFIEVGYRCSVPRCSAEAALEIHHIDGNPSNNDILNLLVLCANHHTQATKGDIDRLACIEIKRQLSDQNALGVDHKKLANLIAESLVRNSEWPDPVSSNASLKQLSEELDERVGAKAELILRHGDRLIIWIQAKPPELTDLAQAKALALAVACVASSLTGIRQLEVGFSDTLDFVRTSGGLGVAKFRLLFDVEQVAKVAKDKDVPARFWASSMVLVVLDENRPPLRVIEVSMDNFERRAR